jgi:integrase
MPEGTRRTRAELEKDGQQPNPKGAGSIFRVKTNTRTGTVYKWRATQTAYMDEQGRAVQISGTGATKEEAIERRRKNYLKWLVSQGSIPLSALNKRPIELKKTVEEVLEEWLVAKQNTQLRAKHKQEKPVSENVAFRYNGLIKNHILPHIGDKAIRLVTTEELLKLLYETLPAKRKVTKENKIQRVTDEPLLGTTPLRTVQNILNMSFAWAYRNQIILENPMLQIANIEKAEPRDRGLEGKKWISQRLIANLAGTDEEARWIFAFYGLRQSERLGITWNNLKLKPKSGVSTLRINQQLIRNEANGKLELKPPKTKAGNRIIPLDKRVENILVSHRARQNEWKKSPNWKPLAGLEDLVFTNKNGTPIRHQTDNKQWHTLLEQRGQLDKNGEPKKPIPYIPMHSLRHLAITIMIENGTPIEIIRDYAGHSDEEITRLVYSHTGHTAYIPAVTELSDSLFKELKTPLIPEIIE